MPLLFAVAACGRFGFEDTSPVDAPVPAPIDAARADAAPPLPVAAIITADNGVSLGWGGVTTLVGFVRGAGTNSQAQIQGCPVGDGPEQMTATVDAAASSFVYVVTWADVFGESGWLGRFQRGAGPVRVTDGEAWQVCATGDFHAGLSNGPTQAEVQAALESCAAGTTASAGWVDANGAVSPGAVGALAVGEANDSDAGDFVIACQSDGAGLGIEAIARWLWYDPADGTSAFTDNGGNRTEAFHVYRLPASEVASP